MLDSEIDTLSRVRRETEQSGYELLRAAPRDEHHVLVILSGADGGETFGQWFANPRRAARAADATAAVAAPGAVVRVGPHLFVQHDGADRRLPALHGLVRRGASLLAHRPERRGVVTHTVDGRRCYTKVVRPERLPALLTAHRAVAGISSARVPTLLSTDPVHGTVTMAELPGVPLHQLLADPLADEATLRSAGVSVGHALAGLHQAHPLPQLPLHDAAAEVDVVRQWIARAAGHRLLPLPHASVEALVELMTSRLRTLPPVEKVIHRDLHDKQIVVGDETGLLDLDIAALGHPALDLANLAVHLELRVHQGVVGPERARACLDGLFAAYPRTPLLARGLRGYGVATRLRLLGVYAFRPFGTPAACRLITHPLFQETS